MPSGARRKTAENRGVTLHPLFRPFAAGSNARRQSQRVAQRQRDPGALQLLDHSWAAEYEKVRRAIEASLPGSVRRLTHVGSTAIPGIIGKPVVDIDLLVDDVTDEATYVPQLETAGFRLIFRDDLAGAPHRQLTFAEPNTNLHAWNVDAIEPQRHELFTRWLASHPDERLLYSDTKAVAAADPSQRYNDGKAAVVYDIYERAFAADRERDHTPQPRG